MAIAIRHFVSVSGRHWILSFSLHTHKDGLQALQFFMGLHAIGSLGF